MSIHLDTDPLSGAVSMFDYDETTGAITITSRCDVTAIIDANKASHNHEDGWVDDEHDMRLVAKVPIALAYKWLVEHGVSAWRPREHWPALRKLLNSNEYRDARWGPRLYL